MRGRRVLACVLVLLTLASWGLRWGGGDVRIGGLDAHDGAQCVSTFANGVNGPMDCAFSLTPVFAIVLLAMASGVVLGVARRERAAAIVLAAAIPLVLLDACDGRGSQVKTLTTLEVEVHVVILAVAALFFWRAPRGRSLKREAPAPADS